MPPPIHSPTHPISNEALDNGLTESTDGSLLCRIVLVLCREVRRTSALMHDIAAAVATSEVNSTLGECKVHKDRELQNISSAITLGFRVATIAHGHHKHCELQTLSTNLYHTLYTSMLLG